MANGVKNKDMRRLFKCTEAELRNMKTEVKSQMSRPIYDGEPLLGNYLEEFDPDQKYRKQMWNQVAKQKVFDTMLSGRRWASGPPRDFQKDLVKVKTKIVGDLNGKARSGVSNYEVGKRKWEESEMEDTSDDDSGASEIPATDRNLRLRPGKKYVKREAPEDVSVSGRSTRLNAEHRTMAGQQNRQGSIATSTSRVTRQRANSTAVNTKQLRSQAQPQSQSTSHFSQQNAPIATMVPPRVNTLSNDNTAAVNGRSAMVPSALTTSNSNLQQQSKLVRTTSIPPNVFHRQSTTATAQQSKRDSALSNMEIGAAGKRPMAASEPPQIAGAQAEVSRSDPRNSSHKLDGSRQNPVVLDEVEDDKALIPGGTSDRKATEASSSDHRPTAEGHSDNKANFNLRALVQHSVREEVKKHDQASVRKHVAELQKAFNGYIHSTLQGRVQSQVTASVNQMMDQRMEAFNRLMNERTETFTQLMEERLEAFNRSMDERANRFADEVFDRVMANILDQLRGSD